MPNLEQTTNELPHDEPSDTVPSVASEDVHSPTAPSSPGIGIDDSKGNSIVKDDVRGSLLQLRSSHAAENDDLPRIDVVRVTCLRPEADMESLEDILWDDTRQMGRRDFLFSVGPHQLLVGDLVQDSIEKQAKRLLQGVVEINSGHSSDKRIIVFMAYDFGALVVKMALSLAARFQDTYPDVFFQTGRMVFIGCHQRGLDIQEMTVKLSEFLLSSREKNLLHLATPESIRRLAFSVVRTTELFLSSKITLRCRSISIYADGEQPRQIHPSLDSFTATLGVPSEFSIPESGDDYVTKLSRYLSNNLESSFCPANWVAVEKTLLCLSSPHRHGQPYSRRTSVLRSAQDTQTYRDWGNRASPQILYVYGDSTETARDLAEEISHKVLEKLPYAQNYNPSFTFDSRDPLRDSISVMLSNTLVQSTALGGYNESSYQLIKDLFLMPVGWGEISCSSVFKLLRFSCFPWCEQVLLLHNFDECTTQSRAWFLEKYSDMAKIGENDFKVIITSRKPGSLLLELSEWPKLNVDDFLHAVDPHSELDNVIDDIRTQYPFSTGEDYIETQLDNLRGKLEEKDLRKVVRLIEDYTGWPKLPSRNSLSHYSRMLELVSFSDTPKSFLDRMMRSDVSDGGLKWILSWLLCSQRLLSRQELEFICSQHSSYEPDDMGAADSTPSATFTARSEEKLQCLLRLFVDFGHDQVTIRHSLRDLLEPDSDSEGYVWAEIRSEAHHVLFEFCAAQIISMGVTEKLEAIFQQYKVQLPEDEEIRDYKHAAPLTPDGRDITFYAIWALPYHLFKIGGSPTFLQDFCGAQSKRASMAWANMYWAMSSLRTPEPPHSALVILGGLGTISLSNTERDDAALNTEYILTSILNGRGNEVSALLEECQLSIRAYEDVLAAAVLAADEDTALRAVSKIQANSTKDVDFIISPRMESATWAATWLGFAEVVKKLLQIGVDPDMPPARDGSYPTLMYAATVFGHSAVVQALIFCGGKTEVFRRKENGDEYSNLHVAALNGDVDLIRLFVSQNNSLLHAQTPRTPLYLAVEYGYWQAVSLLIELGADPNFPHGSPKDSSHGWTALAAACRGPFPLTVKALLEKGADPNVLGPYGVDTPLWFCTVNKPDVECVQQMMQHGADPNHEHFSPPLLHEILRKERDVNVLTDICDALLAGKTPININMQDSAGYTALMVVCELGKLPLVRWLLGRKADLHAVNHKGRDALQLSIIKGQDAIVQELLKNMSRPEAPGPEQGNSKGSALLYVSWAAHYGRTNILKMLIDDGHGIDQEDVNGYTPIFFATKPASDAGLVRLLVENGANLNTTFEYGQSLLHIATVAPLDVLRVLLEFRKDIDIDATDDRKVTPLMLAVGREKFDHVQLLIRAGADVTAVNSYGDSALHYAAGRTSNGIKMLSLLLSQPKVDPNVIGKWGGTALHMACKALHIDGIRFLLDHGADINLSIPNIFGSTPLINTMIPNGDASRDEKIPKIDVVTRVLVSRQADVQKTVRGSRFYTALSAACFSAGVATINFLLDEGASADLADIDTGRLPHHFAAANGIENFEAIMQIYRQEGGMMIPDKEGKTCFHWAAQFGNLQVVNYIIDRRQGADIDQKDSDGWTPLCWAVRPLENNTLGNLRSEKSDFLGVVRTLLEHGADPTIECDLATGPDNEIIRVTPLKLARLCSADRDIIDALEGSIKFKDAKVATDEGAVDQRYTIHKMVCDICFNQAVGRMFDCQTCPDYLVCSKCLRHVETFHTRDTQGDGEPHELKDRGGEEYQRPPTPPSPGLDSVRGLSDNEDSQEKQGDGEGSGGYDLTEEIDLSGLELMV